VAAGLGVRSKRYAALIDDGVVRWIDIEDNSSAPPFRAPKRRWKSFKKGAARQGEPRARPSFESVDKLFKPGG